jgi:ribonuclease E
MRSIESLSLSILRVAEEHAMKENTGQVLVQVPVEIGNYLLNEKRRALSEIEQRHDAPIVIVADDQLETPHYEVTRLRENELGEESSRPSYQRGTPRKLATIALTKANLNVPATPAVTNVRPAQPAPIREPREEAPVAAPMPAAMAAPTHSVGMVERILRFFRGTQAATAAPAAPARPQESRGRNERNDRGGQRRDGRGKTGARNEPRRDESRRDEPRGNRQQQAAQPRQQDGKPRNEGQPKQQKQQKQADSRQADSQRQPAPATAKASPEDNRQPQAPRPPRLPRADTAQAAVIQPASTDEAAKPQTPISIASASLPETMPSSVQATADAPVGDAESTQGSAGEGGRRRRGRRGGRRRRRGGAEGGTAGEGASQDQDDFLPEDVSAAQRSQPEFDFEEEDAAPAASTALPMTQAAARETQPPVADRDAREDVADSDKPAMAEGNQDSVVVSRPSPAPVAGASPVRMETARASEVSAPETATPAASVASVPAAIASAAPAPGAFPASAAAAPTGPVPAAPAPVALPVAASTPGEMTTAPAAAAPIERSEAAPPLIVAAPVTPAPMPPAHASHAPVGPANDTAIGNPMRQQTDDRFSAGEHASVTERAAPPPVPFALEPAELAPAPTAAVGTPENGGMASLPRTAGLFDAPPVAALEADPAEAAAIAVAQQDDVPHGESSDRREDNA